jgi:SAM-dependent methyltransferase
MNSSHSKVTDWGLKHVSIANHDTILDVGCGGGRTVNKLAAIATQGKVYGVDYSEESVAFTERTNARWIEAGRVEIRQASVSQLPFPNNTFDVITAVETHYFWPNLPADLHEVSPRPQGRRHICPRCRSLQRSQHDRRQTPRKISRANRHDTPHSRGDRGLLTNAGYSNVQSIEESGNGWICGTGRKPISQLLTVSE